MWPAEGLRPDQARCRRQGRRWQAPRAPALLCALGVALLLTGCGGGAKQGVVRLDDVPGPEPRVEPKARYGNMQSYVVFGRTYYPKSTSRGHVEQGIASWYGPKFHGRKTSSGEPYDMHQLTAAHKTLPLPTYALVTNLENGRNLIVRINDRGPFVGDRIIDLSYAAAKQLGMDKQGTAKVQVISIDPRDHDGKVPKTLGVAAAELERYRGRRGQAPASATGTARADQPTAQPTPTPAPRTAQRRPPEPGLTATGFSRAAVPTRTPEARPAAAGGTGWYLQVGAFGTRANAEQMRRRLGGQLGTPVKIADQGANADGDDALFRVRVGPVGERADAERLAGELQALGVGPSLLVPR